ncbi:hypothetical protein [Catenulispora sp. GAS73]|uniref:hypothetical protein n=1 Tax=Catenulispora sp. GAS73 TaxID=3156269 RepID=UPI003511629A
MSPLCTPFETLPVTVEDGDGGADDEDDEEDEEEDEATGDEEDELEEGLGEASGLEGDVAAGCETASVRDEWPRPTATTAPAVPPAIRTHPTENAAMVARLRPAPGPRTPGNAHP